MNIVLEVRILCDIPDKIIRGGQRCRPRISLFIIVDTDIVSGWAEWIPGDVEPAVAGEELVGMLPILEEVHECRELLWVGRTNVGSLTE